MDMQQTSTPNTKMTAIERALAAAKARKAMNAASDEAEAPVAKKNHPKAAAAQKAAANAELTAIQREEARQKRDAERAKRAEEKAAKVLAAAAAKTEKAAARAAAKAEKAAAKAAAGDKKPAHMKKVERARAKLPTLPDAMTTLFDDVTSNHGASAIEVFAQHLLIQARAMRTLRAQSATPVSLGSTVRIIGGDPKFVGMTGEVVHSQKLRLLVKVEGVKKPVYLYTGEAEPTSADAAAE